MEMSHSDLCDNKLSEFEGDENRTVEKIVEIMKTIKLCQFEPKTRRGDRESFKEEGI